MIPKLQGAIFCCRSSIFVSLHLDEVEKLSLVALQFLKLWSVWIGFVPGLKVPAPVLSGPGELSIQYIIKLKTHFIVLIR